MAIVLDFILSMKVRHIVVILTAKSSRGILQDKILTEMEDVPSAAVAFRVLCNLLGDCFAAS